MLSTISLIIQLVIALATLAMLYTPRIVKKRRGEEYHPTVASEFTMVAQLWYLILNNFILEAIFWCVAVIVLLIRFSWHIAKLVWYTGCARVTNYTD